MIKPQIAFFATMFCFVLVLKIQGPNVVTFLWLGLGSGNIIICDVIVICVHCIQYLAWHIELNERCGSSTRYSDVMQLAIDRMTYKLNNVITEST